MKYDMLFQPVKLGSLLLKNRFIMAPMSVHMTDDGSLTEKEIAFIERRAEGGAAMLIIGSICIKADGNFGGQIFIDSDERIRDLKKLTKAVHRHDCLICAQIHHAGRETNAKTSGYQPVAPSYFEPEAYVGLKAEYDPPRVLSTEEVGIYIEAYAQAVRRAKEAGFDACELHCAHGYLICSFMSPLTNKRTDQYGGSFLGRMRFIAKILERSYELVGNDYPIVCRIVGDEFREQGITMELSIRIAQYLESLGIVGLNVSAGMYPYVRTVPNMYHKHGINLYLADNIHQEVSIPIMAAGQLDRPEIQLDAVKNNKLDLICLGRTLIADPDYPNKLQSDREDTIIYCIACNKGCHDRSSGDRQIKCGRNVQTGREWDEHFLIKPVTHKKNIMVIGGGPAGMEAARVASLRGHIVHLYEQRDYLGGQLRLAAVPPHKSRYNEICDDLETDIKKNGVRIHLNTEVTETLIAKNQYDAVILASGSIPYIPPILGLDQDFVVPGNDILSGKIQQGRRIAIIGGGAIGAEIAHYLMEELQREVYVIEMSENIAIDLPQDSRIKLFESFDQTSDLHIVTGAKLTEIGNHEIHFIKNGKQEQIKNLDIVVMAVGLRPNQALKPILEKYTNNIYIIGDATTPKDYVQAFYQGFVAGNAI